jgi:hypothetical protein
LHCLVNEISQFGFAHAGDGLGLVDGALQRVSAHGFLDEARQAAFAATALRQR